MFYLHKHLVATQGDKITGMFSLGPNKAVERDLDIVIKYSHSGKEGLTEAEHFYKMC